MRLLLPALLAALAAPASAHVVIADPAGDAGSYHVAAFRVSHGCAGSPTVSLRIEIPASVTTARPQPKPGWIMRAEKAPLAKPIPNEGGGQQVERVTAVTWMGRLDNDQFDEFRLLLKLPATGPLYFPTLQRCEQGATAWTGVPAKGQARSDVKDPAPVLNVRKGPPQAEHKH